MSDALFLQWNYVHPDQPVSNETVVEVEFEDGHRFSCRARWLLWWKVKAYRVLDDSERSQAANP